MLCCVAGVLTTDGVAVIVAAVNGSRHTHNGVRALSRSALCRHLRAGGLSGRAARRLTAAAIDDGVLVQSEDFLMLSWRLASPEPVADV